MIMVSYRQIMATGKIDREWDRPIYVQIADILREQLASGEIQPRRPIPSVRTLCEQYGVARVTATKAIKLLADDHLVHQVVGRGWFAGPPS